MIQNNGQFSLSCFFFFEEQDIKAHMCLHLAPFSVKTEINLKGMF